MILALREWLTHLVAVTLLLSLLRTLTPPGAVRKAASFTGSLVLAAALLQPLAENRLSLPDWDPSSFRATVQARQAALEQEGTAALAREVSARTEAAILRQADALGLSGSSDAVPAGLSGSPNAVPVIRVTVRTSDGIPRPWSAALSLPRDRALEAWIAAELDIPPERQIWTNPADRPPSSQSPG